MTMTGWESFNSALVNSGRSTSTYDSWASVVDDGLQEIYTLAMCLTGGDEVVSEYLIMAAFRREARSVLGAGGAAASRRLKTAMLQAFRDRVWRRKDRGRADTAAAEARPLTEGERSTLVTVLSNLRASELTLAFDSLPESQRVPLALCDLGGLSYREAGELLGMPRAALRKRIAAGRDAMKWRLHQVSRRRNPAWNGTATGRTKESTNSISGEVVEGDDTNKTPTGRA